MGAFLTEVLRRLRIVELALLSLSTDLLGLMSIDELAFVMSQLILRLIRRRSPRALLRLLLMLTELLLQLQLRGRRRRTL